MLGFRSNKGNSVVKKEVTFNARNEFCAKGDKYKKKYHTIKRIVKELIFENAALCDQIAVLQEKTLILIEERSFLFRKLQQFNPIAVPKENEKIDIARKKVTSIYQDSFRTPGTNSNHENCIIKKTSSNKKRNEKTVLDSSAIKPVKKTTVVRKKKIVKSIPLDASGKPIFPIVLGDFTVHSLGEVCEKPEYHNEDLIFPVGYCSTRIYGSLKDPEKQCVYTCKVMDGGQAPRFEIVADTDLDVPLVSTSIDQCHSMLLSHINTYLGTEVVNSKGRGADFFGISHPTIHHLIQASPGVRKCKGYIWTKFEINPNYEYVADEMEASLSYNALLRSISFSKSHLESMIKHEPPGGEYGEDNVTALRNILLS